MFVLKCSFIPVFADVVGSLEDEGACGCEVAVNESASESISESDSDGEEMTDEGEWTSGDVMTDEDGDIVKQILDSEYPI